jgi:hypothetical protein
MVKRLVLRRRLGEKSSEECTAGGQWGSAWFCGVAWVGRVRRNVQPAGNGEALGFAASPGWEEFGGMYSRGRFALIVVRWPRLPVATVQEEPSRSPLAARAGSSCNDAPEGMWVRMSSQLPQQQHDNSRRSKRKKKLDSAVSHPKQLNQKRPILNFWFGLLTGSYSFLYKKCSSVCH